MSEFIHRRRAETQRFFSLLSASMTQTNFSPGSCKINLNFTRRLGGSAAKFLFLAFIFSFIAHAQTTQFETAPPPLKIISKAEKAQLAAATDVKDRTKLSLELMDARLLKAEDFSKQEAYPQMFDELGSFHALMDDTIDFLLQDKSKQTKVLDNFKRVELSLRKYITRLEIIRRDLPIKYELYVRNLVKYVREARSKAVEPMFGDTVLPDEKPR